MPQESFKALLRKSGYKATPPRLAILEAFKRSRAPLSAQELIDLLPRNTDRVTIYRTLKSFQNKGIIKQVDLRHNHAHYEIANLGEHHHLICLRCGKVEDVHHCGIDEMENVVLRSSKHFAEIQQHALEFYGVCKACARKPAGE